MKLGTQVSLTPPKITGTVVDVVWDKEADEKRILIECADGHTRWFLESQLDKPEVAQ